MLLKVKRKGTKILPSEVKGKYAYKRNAVIIIRNDLRVLFVDYLIHNLGSYEPPPFLRGYIYYYEIIDVPEEYSQYLRCIAGAIEQKVKPLFKNKNLKCNNEITVVVE